MRLPSNPPVALAAVDDDADILQRKAGDRTRHKHLLDTFCTPA